MASYRNTCAALLTRLRELLADADPDGDCLTWTQEQLQTALDARSTRVRYLELEYLETRQPGGAVEYLDFYAGCGDWEDTVTLVDGQYRPLTPSSANLELGEWSFSTEPDLPVYLSGRTYDLYAAAADVLEQWAAKVKLDYPFSPGGGQRHERDQKHRMILATAERYRALQRVGTATLVRSDVHAY